MYFESSFLDLKKKRLRKDMKLASGCTARKQENWDLISKLLSLKPVFFSCILCLPEMSEWLAPTTVQGLGRIFKVPMGAFSWFTLSWTVRIRTEPTSALLPESGIFYKAGILTKRSQPVSPLWGTCGTGFWISLVSDPTYHAYPFSWYTGTHSCTLVII